MKQTYLDKLEFYKIKEILESFCVTYVGKNFAKELCPCAQKAEVKKLLNETTRKLHFNLPLRYTSYV